ncbi:AcrR family transcriptional regulator [Deinococcus metalli]|uniref:AcrR family transcriptional regulator n=1 Tax=Deinococcus metalli TaxID=1141878 RepID=A0A7W8KEV5_9DEIO|nr:TetR/AcrR family transcriptional regulator [Deinococcus metalli]MBB5375833.1 AcrR family transcriptional regulator [Deinococcus metalli]GHF36700.1 putative HTH-type transcriptional regulator YdgC [Deinococcus metalli]
MQGDPGSPLHPQTKRHLHNTQRLRAAAIREFARHGLHGTKVSNIVAAAQLTQPSFYRTWPSKEAAFEEIVSETLRSWRDAATQIMAGPPGVTLERRMAQGLSRLYALLVADLELTHMVLREDTKNADRYLPFIDIYTTIFLDAQARGLIARTPAESLAQLYTAVTERLFYARLYTRQRSVDAAVQEAMTLLLPLFQPSPKETP